MRVANVGGRLALAVDEQLVDVERASHGRFSADPALAYLRWDELVDWARSSTTDPAHVVDAGLPLGPPVTAPRQVFAIGLNYRAHAAEAGHPIPEAPLVFTKYVTSWSGRAPGWPCPRRPSTSRRSWSSSSVGRHGTSVGRPRGPTWPA